MLEQAGINIKSLNVDKLKAEYQELMKQKSELTSTYKDCEKEVHELNESWKISISISEKICPLLKT